MRQKVDILMKRIQMYKSKIQKAEEQLSKAQSDCKHKYGAPVITQRKEPVVCDEGHYGFTEIYEVETYICKNCGRSKIKERRVNYTGFADCQGKPGHF